MCILPIYFSLKDAYLSAQTLFVLYMKKVLVSCVDSYWYVYSYQLLNLFFRNINWKLCLICQKATKEVLKCPLNALGSANC